MKEKIAFTKRDLFVTLACVVFLLANIAAIGPRGRRHAKQMLCLSNLYKWGTIFQMYTQDNDGYFHGELGSGGSSQSWVLALKPYYDDPRIRLCPMAVGKAAWGIYSGETHDYGSYGLNCWVCNEEPSVSDWWDQVGNLWRTPSVKGAKDIPMFADCGWVDGWPQPYDNPPDYDGQIGMYFVNTMRQFCTNRHNGFVNSAFLDFSARKIGLKELWKLEWHRTFEVNGPWTIAGFDGNAAKCAAAWDKAAPWMKNFPEY